MIAPTCKDVLMIIRNKFWVIALIFALFGCASRSDKGIGLTTQPTSTPLVMPTRTPQPTFPPVVTLVMPTRTLGPPAPTSIPEPTSIPYSVDSSTLTIDLNTSFAPSHILLSMKQRLILIPQLGWGSDGWDVTFDPQFLQLDPAIDAKHPPETGWIWTPRQSGRTKLRIESIVPCRNFSPPCGKPNIGFMLNITITEQK